MKKITVTGWVPKHETLSETMNLCSCKEALANALYPTRASAREDDHTDAKRCRITLTVEFLESKK